MNINQYFQSLMARVSRETGDVSASDLRLLIQGVTGFSTADFIAKGETPLSTQQIETIDKFAARRSGGEPVSRILGTREFWSLNFTITPDTLDPRPDTEILVEQALKFARSKPAGMPLRILDLGSGSGCILISLLTELPHAIGVGVDVNPGAVEVARANAATLGVADRAEFRHGSWLDPLVPGESFDLVVSNPPYIPNLDIPNLAKEVRNHDPILALEGGEDGLNAYRFLFKEVKKVLHCGGIALYEIGHGQLPDIVRLVDDSHATLGAVTPDLAGIPRVVEITYGDNEKNV